MKKSALLLTVLSIIGGCQAAAPIKNNPVEQVSSSSTQSPAAHKTVTIYTMATCFYCQKAKQILDEHNIPYTVIDIFSKQGLIEELEKRSGSSTVPQVYVDDQFIGGYKDLLFADIFGDLRKKLLG